MAEEALIQSGWCPLEKGDWKTGHRAEVKAEIRLMPLQANQQQQLGEAGAKNQPC